MQTSMLRELLKLTDRPGLISMAGGLPAPESFPLKLILNLTRLVIAKYGANAFQYSQTEGFLPLRTALAVYLNHHHIKCKTENLIISSGSQGILDTMGKIFINKGDKIAVEAPTYLGAIQAFNAYEPKYISLKTDENGILPNHLARVLTKHQVKLIYLNPTFQNPSGRTLSKERRIQVANIIKKHRVLLLEDDPYSSLRFNGRALRPIMNFAPENTVYTSTFSKIFAPGLRVGYAIAPDKVAKMLVLAKQGIDLHSGTFSQALAAEYILGAYMDKQIKKNIRLYAPRKQAMIKNLAKYMPAGFKWSNPDGGLFVWVEGPKDFDSTKFFQKAINTGVAYVPGTYFYTKKGAGKNTIRLNFSNVNEKNIQKGIKILANIIKN